MHKPLSALPQLSQIIGIRLPKFTPNLGLDSEAQHAREKAIKPSGNAYPSHKK